MSELAPPLSLEAAPIAAAMQQDLQERVFAIREVGFVPHLAVVTDDNTRQTAQYIRMKQRNAAQLGIEFTPSDGATETLTSRTKQWATDDETTGVIIQMPVGAKTYTDPKERRDFATALLNIVPPERDVDGLATETMFTPATVLGVAQLLRHYDQDFRNRAIALYGYGQLVNKPLHALLEEQGAKEIIVIDEHTPYERKREILHYAGTIIAATGQAHSLTTDLVGTNGGKFIIDAGTSEKSGTIVGDVALPLREIASSTPGWAITPEKGGVGPLTVKNLLGNVVTATEWRIEAGTLQPAWQSDVLDSRAYVDLVGFGNPGVRLLKAV